MRNRLDPKLEAVLARLSERLGPLSRTQAVKLPYLVDVVASRALGRPITPATYEAWDFGVVATEVFQFSKTVGDHGALRVEQRPYSELTTIAAIATPREALSADEREVVDFVADTYGGLPYLELANVTKRLNPHIRTWGSNQRASLGEAAYARLSDSWQRTVARIQEVDLDDETKWERVTGSPREHLRTKLGL